MRVLLYEWCCSGGLAGGDASIAREGRMMLEALAADAAKVSWLDVSVLVDSAMTLMLPDSAHAIAVKPGEEIEQLLVAARDADWTLIVAPESEGILLDRVRRVRAASGRVLAVHDEAIATASDKQATIEALAARGVPVPAGRPLAADEPIPAGFHLPAVRKGRTGCGCEELSLVTSRTIAPAPMRTRLEAFVAGIPVGVSVLCGPRAAVPLPAMQQRFSSGATPRYLGSDLLTDRELTARATTLALAAAKAIGAEAGWLGIDVILGTRADGRDDRVLEINPRLTTSIVGLAPLFASSLVAAMIESAVGGTPVLEQAAGISHHAACFSLPIDV